MGKRFTREEIIRRLRKTSEEGKPIIAAGSSAGIIAKCAELGGADLIMVYSSGKARIRGFQTTLVENSNTVTLEMFEEIDNVVKEIPIIAGIDATEPPVGSDLAELVKRFVGTGFSGIINFPTYGFFEDEAWRNGREAEGIGFSKEIELIQTARNMDVFTMAYVFFPQDARAMAEVGVDCMVPHAGGTAGGLVGFDAIAAPLEDAAASVQKMIEADGIIIGSPTYFADLTAETKAFIDRTGYVSRANGNLLRRKVGAAVSAVRRAGSIYVLDSINHFFLINDMVVPGSSYWNLGIGRDIGDVESDAEGLQTMRDLGRNMAWLLEKLHD